MSNYDFDLFTIGAGSGGVRASRVAASYGARVAVAEEYRVGGTCVIRGCVPKKMLVYGAHFASDLDKAHRFGWNLTGKSFDWKALRDIIQDDVTRLNGLYTETLKGHDISIFNQRAEILGPHKIGLKDGTVLTAEKILIAVGARPHRLDFPGAEYAITSNEAFLLEDIPKKIVIAGGGYIAMEFAGIFNELGSEVHLVNRSAKILRGYDKDLSARLIKACQDKGITFHFNEMFDRIVKRETGTFCVELSNSGTLEAETVMFATGRVPNTDGLGLSSVGAKLGKRGEVIVNDCSATTASGIYAIGDATDRIQLTPIAIREGQAFAESAFGGLDSKVDYSFVPSAVFSTPPVAAVGMTEEDALKNYTDVKVYISDFRPMKNALLGVEERSFYKMIVEAATERVVGVHMIGPDCPEIMQLAAVAVKAGLKKNDFDNTLAIHPTMSEELVLLK